MISITQLSPEAWQQYKTIRLEALQADPLAFGGAYADEVHFTETVWRERIGVMWFAIMDEQPVGMIGVLSNTGQWTKHKGIVVSLWVRPAFRGQGIGKSLLKKVQSEAIVKGMCKLQLDVSTTQIAAIKLYESVGFQQAGLLKKELFIDSRYHDAYIMSWLSIT